MQSPMKSEFAENSSMNNLWILSESARRVLSLQEVGERDPGQEEKESEGKEGH
jgi:hypothetical protein